MEVSDDHPDLVEMGLSLLGYFNSSAVPPQWPKIDERSNPQCRIFTTQPYFVKEFFDQISTVPRDLLISFAEN